MRQGNFCPLCGKTTGAFVKAICLGCHLEKKNPVQLQEKIPIQQCKNCGKTMFLGKMLPMDDESLKAIIGRRVKTRDLSDETHEISLERLQNGKISAHVVVKAMLSGIPVEIEKETILVPHSVNCDACMRLLSDYYEATIQLRAKEKGRPDFQKILRRLQQLIRRQSGRDGLAAITRITKGANGFDITIGSKKAAYSAVMQLKKEFGGETKMSHTLAGVDKSGKTKKRFTFLLRT